MLFRKRKSPTAEASIKFLHNEIALLENALQYDLFLRTGAGLISDAHAQAIEDAARAHLETLKAMAEIRASYS
jgi:DNA-binding transcriptional LysR family regulator